MESNRPIVLSVKDVKKKIGKKWIIKGVSFDVRAGEIFGFLGPNGSGKTTTIRMAVGLIKPTEGTVILCGKDVHREHTEALMHVGSIVENPELYSFLTGWENLQLFASMTPGVHERRIREVVEFVGMDGRIHDKVKTYSLGMRQRLGIAQALLSDPKLLILDEPTNGLDPQGIKELRLFIRKLADEGMAVFVSSHLLSEIQLMCDRVAIISHGEVIAVDEVDTLLDTSEDSVMWQIEPLEEGAKVLASMEGVTIAQVDGENVPDDGQDVQSGRTVTVQMNRDLIPLASEKLVSAQIKIYAIETKTPTLEELFLRLTEGETIG